MDLLVVLALIGIGLWVSPGIRQWLKERIAEFFAQANHQQNRAPEEPTDDRTLTEILEDERRRAQRSDRAPATAPSRPAVTHSNSGANSPLPPPANDPVTVRSGPTRTREPAASPSQWTRPAPQPSPPAQSGKPPRWVPFGEQVTLPDGFVLNGGGFHVASKGWFGRHSLAALVDPALRYSRGAPDWAGEYLPYWPRYADLSERARGTFLAFLNSSRDMPDVNVGYVFLYFYGLEHRLLREIRDDPSARAEAMAIVAEVYRLRDVYGHNHSIQRYCSELLGIAPLVLGMPPSEQPAPEMLPDDWTMEAKVGLGRLVAEQRTVPEDWAFLWARLLTDQARSHIWDVVRAELKALFAKGYAQMYPRGLTVPPGRSRLKVEYVWAAPSLGREQIATDLPDVTRLVAAVRGLSTILQQAMAKLEPLRRVRRSKNRTPMAELCAVPEELRGSSLPPELSGLHAVLSAKLASAKTAVMDVASLLPQCGLASKEKLTKKDVTTLIQVMEAMGFCMEPDLRFMGSPVSSGDQIVIFAAPPLMPRSASTSYAAALLMLQASLAVADADDGIAERELCVAIEAIESQFDLSPAERMRMDAHIEWLRLQPSSAFRIDAKVRALPASDRESFAHVLLDIAAADGHISPAEVALISRFYKALGLDPKRVHADLHHASLGANRSQRRSAGKAGGLDADVIAAKLAETARVQSMLSKIFVDEAGTSSAPIDVAARAVMAPAITGLDGDHVALLAQVLAGESDVLARDVFDAACEPLGLLPDGALEMLNEAAFTHIGEALFEDEDPLYINPQARTGLMAMLST